MNKIKVTISIEEIKDHETEIHEIDISLVGRDEVNVESCIEELLVLATEWATSWLKYPGMTITIGNEQL